MGYVESWTKRVLDNAPKHETVSDVLTLMANERFMNRGRWAAYVVRLGAASQRAKEHTCSRWPCTYSKETA